ncbi:hypothetical protein CAXC1_80010 [Candidatus Xenohaliotis californiensis]|uniref:Uncharacterized protein n=1 Tax=Candidatus Xenohaliotis californiensis TaxID=84677 RepID=A0ABP0EU63_9RICK|nr:hypothetical protein CAXC1_80010 [Candidatus Xenohaliotis californiensis]
MKNNKKLVHTYYIDNEPHTDSYYGIYDNNLFVSDSANKLLLGLSMILIGSTESNEVSMEVDNENNMIFFIESSTVINTTGSETISAYSKGTMDIFYIDSQTDLQYNTHHNDEIHIFELI